MFFGREQELKQLQHVTEPSRAALIVVTGRRRVGKTRLIQEFSRQFEKSFFFAGLPPTDGIRKEEQLKEFSRLFSQQLGLPQITSTDWGELLHSLAQQTRSGKVLVSLDEVSWMASGSPEFLGQLKNVWDLEFKKNPDLTLIVCGSLSSWIEKNLLSSTGFVGRVSFRLHLKQLGLKACSQFWGERKVSALEKYKVLSVTGGVPRYLEELNPTRTAEENIRHLCFKDGAILFDEFERIFSDLFSAKANNYAEIVSKLIEGPKEQTELAKLLKTETGGTLSSSLDALVSSGFISRDFSWKIQSASKGKASKYRLSDNYLRFYLRYIRPNRRRIKDGSYPDVPIELEKNWRGVFGLQFENLILNNKTLVYELLGIDPRDVLISGPYIQKKTKTHPGCQIDLLIQCRFNTAFVCEIKSSAVTLDVVHEVENKMSSLVLPKKYSLRPALIHLGDLSSKVVESRFFDRMANMSMALEVG